MASLSPSPHPLLLSSTPSHPGVRGWFHKNQDNCGPILHISPLQLWEGLAFPPSCQHTRSTPTPKPKWRHSQEPRCGQFPPLTLSPEGRSPRVQVPHPHPRVGPSQTNRPVHWGDWGRFGGQAFPRGWPRLGLGDSLSPGEKHWPWTSWPRLWGEQAIGPGVLEEKVPESHGPVATGK